MEDKMKTEYAICVTRSFYGPSSKKSQYDGETGQEWRGTHAEAKTKIEELEDGYRRWPELCHNEASAPIYTIVRA